MNFYNLDKIRATPKRMDLPLFISERNSIRRNHMEAMKEYITSKMEHYSKKCQDDNVKLTLDHRKFLHTIGIYRKSKSPGPTCRPVVTKAVRRANSSSITNSKVPPNLYNTSSQPYERLKGSQTTPWRKEMETTAARQYRLGKQMRVQAKDNKPPMPRDYYRGKFLKDKRDTADSTRLLSPNLTTKKRDPNEPGPAHYYVQQHEIAYIQEEFKGLYLPPPVAYQFYKQSCVPVREHDIVRMRNLCGPDRYNVSYAKYWGTHAGKKMRPDLYILIDKQKRFKFRRKQFRKIKKSEYCEPDLAHIKGHGFPRLFMMSKREKAQLRLERDKFRRNFKKQMERFQIKQLKNQVKFFADAHYIDLINNSRPKVDNKWTMCITKPITLRFNTGIRKKMRKKAKLESVAFLSGTPRFKDSVKLQDLVKVELPPELRIQDRPVTRIPIEEIRPRVFEERQQSKVLKWSRIFRFPAMPPVQMVVSPEEVSVKPANAKPLLRGALQPEHFFKSVARTTKLLQMQQRKSTYRKYSIRER